MTPDEYLASVRDLAAESESVEWDQASAAQRRDAVAAHKQLEAMGVAADAHVVAAYEDSMEWAADGHRSVAAALRHECNQSHGTARRRSTRSRKLKHLDEVHGALAAGEITLDAAELILSLDDPDRHDALVEDQKLLVGHATELPYPDLVPVVRAWKDLHDPDQADKDAGKRDEERSVHASSTIGGQVRLDGWLTPVGGAVWLAEMERLEQKLFEADWAEARDRLGDDATASDLLRTPAQRRHDATVEMAERSAAYTGDSPAPNGRVVANVHIDYETFMAELARHQGLAYEYPTDRLCELADGTPLVPSEALNLALGGEVRRIVFGADGHVLDFGRARRLFTKALAEAIGARDRRCQHPGCLLPAAKCQIDHVHEHQDGGPTSEANGQCLCRFHNLWKTNNRDRWRQLKQRDSERYRRRRPPQV